MFRNMVTSLFKHGRIQTTDAKAKELRRWADHMVTLAKRGDLHARRQALAIANEKTVVHRLFETAAEQFGGRAGGYTRLIKLGRRPGDAAPMTMVELVTEEVGDKSKKKSRKTKKQAAAAPQPAAAPKSAPEPAPVEDTTADSSQAEADDTAPAPETVADQNAELEEAPAAKADEADDSAATDADAAETADNSKDEAEEEKSE